MLQHALGELTPEPWPPPPTLSRIGACFVCFERVPPVTEASQAQPSLIAAACWPA
ncbi:MAG TPA: hypothetical protein VGW74_21255 [Propionibacteriaceae bacterium]|nr:hypothetical protein [Propionibacteriaceae bacterium]